MKHFELMPITSDLVVMVDDTCGLNLPDRLHFDIERLWAKEQKKDPELYNGNFLSVIKYDSNIIYGHYVEYKHFLAHIHDADLKKALNLTFVSITGITHFKKNILIGKRSSHVSHFAGHYELAPGGGINSNYIFEGVVDYRHQLLDELEDETTLTQDHIIDFKPLLLAHDNRDKVLTIFVEIHLDQDAFNHIAKSSLEYDEFHWVPEDNVKKFIGNVGPWVPLSLELLQSDLIVGRLH